MRLLLHIGTHKTGTTSVQQFCAANRAWLRARGVWYPDYDVIGKEGHYAHHHLAHAVAGLPTSRGNEPEAEQFFAAVRNHLAHGETGLISAEPFWRHVCPPVALSANEYPADGGAETYWQRRRGYIRALREAIGDIETDIVVTLRRQDDCAESMYKERVKGTDYASSFETYLGEFEHRFAYFDQLKIWQEFFRNIHVLVYEDLVEEGNLVRGFFQSLEFDWAAGISSAGKSNASLSNDLIAFKRNVNQTGLPEDELYDVVLLMQENGFEAGLDLDRGSTLWASRSRRTAFLARFEDQNHQVRQHYAPTAGHGLFPSGDDGRPEYSGLTSDAANRIEKQLERFRQRQA